MKKEDKNTVFALALQQLLKMPYYKNAHATNENSTSKSGEKHLHEKAIMDIFMKNGYTRFTVPKSHGRGKARIVYPELKSEIFKNWEETLDSTEIQSICEAFNMPRGSIIFQPLGSQAWPDMLMLNHDGRVIPIEAKSVEKAGPPMWNDNLPKLIGLYVLSSGSLDETTIFLGKDVITPGTIRVRNLLTAALRAIFELYKPWAHIFDAFNRGYFLTFRVQSFQQGSADVTNYFIHRDRAKCEQSALDFANDL